MFILLSTYFLIILTLLLLPENGWNVFFTFKNNFKSSYQVLKSKGQLAKARECERYLIELEARFSVGHFDQRFSRQTSVLKTPEYGFYSELIDSLLEKYRQLGLPLRDILRELKINLSKEIQFEMKCKAIAKNSYFQFVMMVLVTWGFILFTNSMIELSLDLSHYFVILFLQITGAFFFLKISKKLKTKHFKNFDSLIKKMYSFLTFIEVNSSQSKAIAESEILQLGQLVDERFLPCAYRLEEAIKKWKDLGLSPKTETQAVILEVWNLKEQTFQVFIRHYEGLKFSILAFFFLPAYFYYLYAIFQFFMEQ